MSNKRNQNIHRDKKGRAYIKEPYFIGGKMKFRRIYVIDGIPGDEFSKKNSTDLDFFMNEEFWLINSEKDSNNHCNEQNKQDCDLSDNRF